MALTPIDTKSIRRSLSEDPMTVTLTLPWPLLISDNRRHGLIRGRIVLSADYRTAKVTGGWLAQGAMKGADPLKGRLAMLCTLYEPNTSRKRDLLNLSKIVQDIMNDVVYQDDSQLDDVRWVRGAVDADNPRLEITVTAQFTV